MSADETLRIIAKPWCNLVDLMKLAQIGRNNALELRRAIRKYVLDQGYQLPGNNLPMDKVVEYLKINIDYLEKYNRKEN